MFPDCNIFDLFICEVFLDCGFFDLFLYEVVQIVSSLTLFVSISVLLSTGQMRANLARSYKICVGCFGLLDFEIRRLH